jgi:aspartate carbamoyltransferase catalytic subunit
MAEESIKYLRAPTHRFPVKHFVSLRDVPRVLLEEIFQTADHMSAVVEMRSSLTTLTGRVVALIFFEPSSRTILSFQAAAARLGAGVIVHQSAHASSLAKGETLEDTIKVVAGYSDIIVLRHEDSGAAARAASVSPVPLINGGDGGNEHPTQALIDLYTIQRDFGRLDSLRVGLGFDPLHSRSIHSLCIGLSYFDSNEVVLIGPNELFLDDASMKAMNQGRRLKITQTSDIAALRECDIIYLNRFQVERFSDQDVAKKYRDRYRITQDDVKGSNIKLILDPLPRIHEISEEVDNLPQAAYFRQAAYGVPIRMALLSLMLYG